MEYEPCLQNGKRVPFTETYGPDGVEAWLIAIAALYINFIMAGISRMSGILFVAFMEDFGIDRGLASLPISVRSSIRSLFGPIAGILGQKYGVRPVVIVGSIVGTLSAAPCFYLPDINWITVMWGGVGGVGAALTTTLPQVLIGQHFKKHRTTASGMSFSGGCVGSFIFPYIVEYLLFRYALGGTFLIISGIMMNVIPASMILKPPSWLNSNKKREIKIIPVFSDNEKQSTKLDSNNKVEEKNEDYADSLLQNNEVTSADFNKTSIDKSVLFEQISDSEQLLKSKIDTEFLLKNGDIVVQLLTISTNLQNIHTSSIESSKFPVCDLVKEIEMLFCKIEENHYKTKTSSDECNDASLSPEIQFVDNSKQSNGSIFINSTNKSNVVRTKINIKSIDFLSSSIEHLVKIDRKNILQEFSEEQHEIVSRILENMINLHELLSSYKASCFVSDNFSQNSAFLDGSINSTDIDAEKSNTFSSHIKTALQLHRKPLFLLICLCRTVHFLTFMPMVTIVVDFAKDRGFLTEEATHVINVLSLGDLLGRLGFGWVTDKGFVTLPRFMLIIMILQGLATILLPVMKTKTTIMVFIFAFGLLQGSVFVRHPVLVSRYLKTHEQSIAMGCMDFFAGFIGLTVPIYIGYFRDIIGAYDGVFYINGSLGVFVGCLWFFEPYLFKLMSKSHPNCCQV